MTVATMRLTGRPVIWDREGPQAEPGSPVDPAGPVAIRSGWLARGLRSLGVDGGQRVVVLCCRRHEEERLIAVAALRTIGATPFLPPDWSPSTLRRAQIASGRPTVHLACEEGVQVWRDAGGAGVMVGEGEGVLWWRALECRHVERHHP